MMYNWPMISVLLLGVTNIVLMAYWAGRLNTRISAIEENLQIIRARAEKTKDELADNHTTLAVVKEKVEQIEEGQKQP